MKVEIVLDFDTDDYESEFEMSLGLQARLAGFLNEQSNMVFRQLSLPIVSNSYNLRISLNDSIKE